MKDLSLLKNESKAKPHDTLYYYYPKNLKACPRLTEQNKPRPCKKIDCEHKNQDDQNS